MQAPQTPLAGRYRFSRSLQTGAKSVSWLAIDEKTRRTVIVSALGAARVAGLEGIVGVRHAHLAAIVDVIHDADPDSLPAPAVKAPAVVVAEYVHGTTLHDALRAGRPELLEAVEIVEKLAEAIESLHAIGGVHGAISPRSVVATPENGPQGPVLTQLVAPPSGSYCSPERLRGHGPSTVDDMWALYATLYATLTGTTPFSGTSRERLVKSMVSAGARPLAEHGIFDAALEGLIARGLAAEPGKRSTDIVEFREALGAWKASRTSMAPPEATGQTPIQPADDNEAEWDDDNAQTIVSSAAELLAAARTMGAASKGAADQVEQLLADADAADAAARELEEDEDEDDAPTSVVDIAQLGFVRPSSPEPPKPPRPSSPGKAAPPPPPLPPPPPPASSPHSAGPMAAGGSAYADDEEEAATRILDSQSVLSPEQMEAIRRGMSKDEEEFDEDATVNSQSVLTDAQREEIRRAMMGDFDEEATLALAPDDARMAMAQPPAAGAPPPAAAPPPPPVAPAPVTPQDATIVAGDAPPGKSRKSGVIVWALLTVLVACGVTGYLMRDRLMPLLAGLGLPIPGLKKSIQPKTATPPPGGAAVPSTTPGDAGSDATSSGDAAAAGEVGDAALGAEDSGLKDRPKSLGACVASYFEPGTFHSEHGFGFLCKANDFRKVNADLYQRIVVAGGGKVTPGMKEWSTFDWYELAATAVIRHGCCPADTQVRLPKLGPPCDELGTTLEKMVASHPKPDEVSARTEQFAKVLHCVYGSKIPRPYHYGKPPQNANRSAFEKFWRRNVSQYRQ